MIVSNSRAERAEEADVRLRGRVVRAPGVVVIVEDDGACGSEAMRTSVAEAWADDITDTRSATGSPQRATAARRL